MLDVDLVVHSGDVIDYPFDAADEPATREASLADLRLVREIFDQLPCPYLIIPGNHDHAALFGHVFHDQPLDVKIGEYRLISFRDHEDELHRPTRSALDRERFRVALTDDDPTPQVHIQHFVVWPELNDDYPHSYAAGERMVEMMSESGKVLLVLSGHYHRGTNLCLRHGIHCSTVPAVCEAPYPYRLYELSGDSVSVVECYAETGS